MTPFITKGSNKKVQRIFSSWSHHRFISASDYAAQKQMAENLVQKDIWCDTELLNLDLKLVSFKLIYLCRQKQYCKICRQMDYRWMQRHIDICNISLFSHYFFLCIELGWQDTSWLKQSFNNITRDWLMSDLEKRLPKHGLRSSCIINIGGTCANTQAPPRHSTSESPREQPGFCILTDFPSVPTSH